MFKNIFIILCILMAGLSFAQQQYSESKTLVNEAQSVTKEFEDFGFDVLHYTLTFDFPFKNNAYSGTSTMVLLMSNTAQDIIRLHMEDLTADVVTVDGATVKYEQVEDEILISMPAVYSDTVIVSIAYNGAPYRHGFYFYDRCAYTQSEPEDARAWFPCLDVPWDKASAELYVTVPKGYEVASIGLLESRIVDEQNNTETFHWKTELPVATYLFCVTMSDEYFVWSDWYINQAGDSIEMPYYIFEDDVEKARYDVENMVDAMKIFVDLFGEYPFEKYGTAEVTPYHVGGMEHQTMTTVNKKWIQGDRSVEHGFVHELAHMWWGDAVTLADWPHIWLNESFATYSEALFMQRFYGEDWYRGKVNYSRNTYLTRSRSSDFAIFDPPDGQLFNWGIIYNKGAVVLHTLRQELGDGVFFDILKTYYKVHKFGNATTEDFISVCESVSGRELDWFFDQWIYSPGCPNLEYAWYGQPVAEGELEVLMRIDQVQNPETMPVFNFPLDVGLYFGEEMKRETIRVDQKSQTFSFRSTSMPDSLVLDPIGWTLLKSREVESGPRLSDQAPEAFQLEQNFPNPFNASTTIHFYVGQNESEVPVRLRVYDSQGRLVRELLNRDLGPGAYWSAWDGRDSGGLEASSGSYVIELTAPGVGLTKKALLTR